VGVVRDDRKSGSLCFENHVRVAVDIRDVDERVSDVVEEFDVVDVARNVDPVARLGGGLVHVRP
jgi:hypothetical protein